MYSQQGLGDILTACKHQTAIEENGSSITYSELWDRTDRISSFLLANDFGRQGRVGICVNNVTDMVVCIIGAIRARCVFIPIDASLPVKRFSTIVDKSAPDVIILSGYDRVGKEGNPVRCMQLADLLWERSGSSPVVYPVYQENDDLYIYFTSGSTGEPKGIVGKNSSLWHFLEWEIGAFAIKPGKRFSQLISPYFDAFLRDIFVPLMSGGTICVPPREGSLFIPEKLIEWIDDQEIQFIHCVPSMFTIFNNRGISQGSYRKLEHVLLSGERIIPADLTGWYHTFGSRIQLVNLYGSTEATMISSYYRIAPQDVEKQKMPIGQPISDVGLVVMDNERRPCKPLITGELYIVSDYLSNGYLDNPQLTAERFVTIEGENGNRVAFRTGDKARSLADGSIELLGREDRLIKLRGIRIELDEIERILKNCPAVKNAVVLHDKILDTLVAFVTAGADGIDADKRIGQIGAYLADHLPAYMIPSRLHGIEAIPLLSNGKIDFNLLLKKNEELQEVIPPEDEIEERLLAQWQKMLNTGPISTDRSFYAAGGNSLTMMRLTTRIFAEFRVRVGLAELVAHMTIKKQAILIREKLKSSTGLFQQDAIGKAALRPYYTLSAAQKRLYFLHELDGASLAYNLPQVIELKGDLDRNRLEEAIFKLVRRHESLRTSIITVDEQVVQQIHEDVTLVPEYYESEEAGVNALIGQFIRPFDLAQPPLFRLAIIRTSDRMHLLLIDLHHIVSDGTSEGILIKDFMALYNKEELPPLRLQYKDYSEWLGGTGQQESIKKQREFWIREFQGKTRVLDLPADHPRRPVKNYKGHYKSFFIAREETRQLRSIGEGSGVTLFMTVLALFNFLLSRICTQEEIIVGTPVAGRYRQELEGIVGLFVNTLAIRNEVKGEFSFMEFLLNVKNKTLACFEKQWYPYEDLIRDLRLPRDTSRTPLFDVMFTYQNFTQEKLSIPGLTISPRGSGSEISKFDLSLIVDEYEDGLWLGFEYSSALFEAPTIDRFISYFRCIIAEVTKDPEIRLSEIDIVPKTERHTLLSTFNDTAADYPKDLTIVDLFEQQVRRTPDNVAVRFEGAVTTYVELKERSDRMANYLRSVVGIRTGDLVGLLLEREEELIPSLFGILKAGAVYVPLSPGYPAVRLKSIFSDAGLSAVITRQRYLDAIPIEWASGVVELDSTLERINEQPAVAPTDGPGGNDPAYIIYTSGSTGMPKGVMIEHHSIVNRLLWMQKRYHLSAKDTLLQKTPLMFDVSIWELFWWSFTGASLCVLSPEAEKDPERIIGEIEKNGVTTIHFVPSLLAGFLDAVGNDAEAGLSSLRQVFASGEALGVDDVNTFSRILYTRYGTRLINLYGPTEATVDVSYYECDHTRDINIVPIGKPIDNIRLYVLDNNLHPSPIGVAGELCIGGVGLARGYLNNLPMTAAKFISLPWDEHERVYKTGDLACWMPDGNIRFLGRMDDQVKIRGCRIEPKEIEGRLLQYPGIQEAMVAAKERAGDKYLVGYYVSGKEFPPSDLRAYLTGYLPAYMLPAYYVRIERVPLTANGKADYSRLPAPEIAEEAGYIAPLGDLEETLSEIWSNILKIDKGDLSVNKNFFDLGGDSLKIVALKNKINAQFQSSFSVASMFNTPTISSLALMIGKPTRDQNGLVMAQLQEEAALRDETLKLLERD
jgi:amino acid adenylation domain-containing protein